MTAGGDEQAVGHRPAWAFVALFAAVVVTSSAALLARSADAPPMALAFWRTLGAAVFLSGPAIIIRARRRRADPIAAATGPNTRWLLLGAGAALGLHFATWLASLELTSVAASTTLVTITPLLLAGYLTLIGQPPSRTGWIALALAMAGAVVITVGDVRTDVRALAGDGLAVAGAGFMAVQLRLGQHLRQSMSTLDYTSRAYAVAAVVTGATALVAGIELWGFDRATWAAIVAMVAGPQLLGHTVLNLLLRWLDAVTISLALLLEPLWGTLLVLAVLGEVPPITAVLGAPLILGGLALHLRLDGSSQATPAAEVPARSERPG
ncbi:MAG: DMT family transporter [Actinomycetota bacterium]